MSKFDGLASLLGLSKQSGIVHDTWKAWARKDDFPLPVEQFEGRDVYSVTEVRRWIATKNTGLLAFLGIDPATFAPSYEGDDA